MLISISQSLRWRQNTKTHLLTDRQLQDRLAEHKYAIDTGNVKHLMARHDQDFHNSNPATLQAFGIDLIPPPEKKGDRQRKLNQQETFWIDKLQATKHPGLNEDQDFTAFLYISDSCVYNHFSIFTVHFHCFVVMFTIYEYCGPKYCRLLENLNAYTLSRP